MHSNSMNLIELTVTNASDKLLDEYLSGTTPYSQRYRRMHAEEVPPELDSAVLRRAKQGAAQGNAQLWRRVGPPLAVAATAVLAVTVVMRSNLETPAPQAAKVVSQAEPTPPAAVQELVQEQTRTDSNVAAPAPPVSVATKSDSGTRAELKKETAVVDKLALGAPSVRPSASGPAAEKPAEQSADADQAARAGYEKRKAEPLQQTNVRLRAAQKENESSPSTGAASASSSPSVRAVPPSKPGALAERRKDSSRAQGGANRATTELESVVVTGSLIRGGSQDMALPINVIPEEDLYKNDPFDWLRYIRRLRKEGREAEANDQWEKFSEAYPKYTVRMNDTARPKTK